MTTHNTNSSEFGRAYFVTEVEASAIKKRNKRAQTAEKKCKLTQRRAIEDFETVKKLGITIGEFNQNRMIG